MKIVEKSGELFKYHPTITPNCKPLLTHDVCLWIYKSFGQTRSERLMIAF
jgi:hypothetical protein